MDITQQGQFTPWYDLTCGINPLSNLAGAKQTKTNKQKKHAVALLKGFVKVLLWSICTTVVHPLLFAVLTQHHTVDSKFF